MSTFPNLWEKSFTKVYSIRDSTFEKVDYFMRKEKKDADMEYRKTQKARKNKEEEDKKKNKKRGHDKNSDKKSTPT